MSGGVIAVVVHWEDVEDTLSCVESLVGEPGVTALVVDNGSPHPVGDMLARRSPPVECLRSAQNLGYSGGANLGIRAALERGADAVLLLNNDVRVRAGANAAARRVLDADRRVAAVGPKVLSREDPSRLWLAWGRVTYRQSLVKLYGADRPDGPEYRCERDVEWIAGCAMWLRAEALTHVGLFDEEFFLYHEEVDWCVRARAAGRRVVYCPGAIVTHSGRGSAGDSQSIRVRKYFTARNSVLFARKHASRLQRAKLACFLGATLPLQLLWQCPRGRAGEVWLKILGVRDALAGGRPPLERLGLR